MTGEEREATRAIHEQNFEQAVQLVQSGQCDLLVLDEILDAMAKGLFEEDCLLSFLEHRPENLEVVLTGRAPSEKLRACWIT